MKETKKETKKNRIEALFNYGILITKKWSSEEPCTLNLVEKAKT